MDKPLHAAILRFYTPNAQKSILEFEAPLPAEYEQLLEKLEIIIDKNLH